MSVSQFLSKKFSFYHRIRARYNIVWTFSGIFYSLLSPFRGLPESVDILFLCHDVHRYANKNGKRYAPLIDTIVEAIKDKSKTTCLTLATPFSKEFGRDCYSDVRIHSHMVIKAFILRILLNRTLSLQNVKNDPLIKAYKKLLLKIKPKSVIGIQPSVEFCIAAKQLGITVYDMQHGLISDVNYYAISKRKAVNQEGWPDYVLCWDQESADRLLRITEGYGKSIIIGNPSYHSKTGIELHAQQYITNAKNSKYQKEILITLTYLDYGVYHPDECYREIGIPKQLVDVIIQSTDTYWRLRLHPVQTKFYFNRINEFLNKIFNGAENVEWQLYSNVSFGAAIHGCTGHITVGSASALDAAQNSVPSLLVGCSEVSDFDKTNLYFGEYLQSGFMKYVHAFDLTKESLSFFGNKDFSFRGETDITRKSRSIDSFSNFIKHLIEKNCIS